MSGLHDKSDEFADHLTNLLRGCIDNAPEFRVVEASQEQQLRIGPWASNSSDRFSQSGFNSIPLLRDCDDESQPRLVLRIEFRVSLDHESEFLAVQHSTHGLWVRPNPRKRLRPLFRIEYDRNAKNKPSAHVHLHAESMELGWIYGTAGSVPPRLHDIHFPVGGRRFRPTVEELLLFLDRERLFTNWLPGWNRIVEQSLTDWNLRQARATVRRHTETAVDQLQHMGYKITPPPTST